MKKMKCEICGSTNIKRTDADVFECQECGIQSSKSEAINLLTEVAEETASSITFSAEQINPAPTVLNVNLESWDDSADSDEDPEPTPVWSDPKLNFAAAKKIETLLLSGNKLGAIGAYREATGLGLADAKNAVERIAQQLK